MLDTTRRAHETLLSIRNARLASGRHVSERESDAHHCRAGRHSPPNAEGPGSELVSETDRYDVDGAVDVAAERDRAGLRAGVAMRAPAVGRCIGDAERCVLEEDVRVGKVDDDLLRVLVRGARAQEHAVAVGNQDVAGAVPNGGYLIGDAAA